MKTTFTFLLLLASTVFAKPQPRMTCHIEDYDKSDVLLSATPIDMLRGHIDADGRFITLYSGTNYELRLWAAPTSGGGALTAFAGFSSAGFSIWARHLLPPSGVPAEILTFAPSNDPNYHILFCKENRPKVSPKE